MRKPGDTREWATLCASHYVMSAASEISREERACGIDAVRKPTLIPCFEGSGTDDVCVCDKPDNRAAQYEIAPLHRAASPITSFE